MPWKTLDDMDLAGKVVLMRVDINVPMEGGRVTDTTRIDKIVPTVKDIIAKGGKVVLLAHFDRPKGKVVPEMSLARMSAARWRRRWAGRWSSRRIASGRWPQRPLRKAGPGEVVLLENTRFHPGEEKNDPALAAAHGGAGRCLCERRLFGRAPGPCLDRRAGAAVAGLRPGG